MGKYKICPRCELNYILETDEYCSVCIDEMRGVVDEIEFEDEFSKLCPHCNVEYITEDQAICDSCKAAIAKLKSLHEDVDLALDESNTVSLESMGEEEEEEELVIDEDFHEELEDDIDPDVLDEEIEDEIEEEFEDDLDFDENVDVDDYEEEEELE